MTNTEFHEILAKLREYLESEKVFIKNPMRVREMNRALEIINELFPDSQKAIKDDPLQMGAVILTVDGGDIIIRGERELSLFAELTSLIDNFEIYPTSRENIHFAAVMQEVYLNISNKKIY